MRKTILALVGMTSLALGPAATRLRATDLPPINTPASTEWFPGKFVWADLFTSDPQAAVTFYTGLFGWTASQIERNGKAYYILSLGDRPIGGIALLPRPIKDVSKGRWIGFVSVHDVAATVAKFTSAGGRVIFPIKQLPQRGTQAILSDREGALIAVVRSSSGDPGEYQAEPGEWIWEQLFAGDPASAASFYRDALGYEVISDTRTSPADSSFLVSGGYSRASVAPVPNRAGAHPAWLSFVRVANVDDAVAKATSLGGRVLAQPKNAAPDSRMAILADPLGSAFGVVELIDNPASTSPGAVPPTAAPPSATAPSAAPPSP